MLFPPNSVQQVHNHSENQLNQPEAGILLSSTRKITCLVGAVASILFLVACSPALSQRVVSSVSPNSSPLVYSAPVTIRVGGTYSGNWESTNSDIPAVTIDTEERIVLTRCQLRGPGHLIHSLRPKANITVRECSGFGTTPKQRERSAGRFLSALAPQSLELSNNNIVGTSGIYIDGARTMMNSLVVTRNKAENIDGRHSDGRGGYLGTFDAVHFLQLNNVRASQGGEVSWNQVINHPGLSRVEDNINLYQSRGGLSTPIRIHNNYIQGAYPANPINDTFSGGGIVLDGPPGTPDLATSYVTIFENQVVSTINYGIGVASGNNISITNNRIVSSGRIKDGPLLRSANVGLYVWDMNGDRSRGAFHNIVASNNLIGWVNKSAQRADSWLPDCASTCKPNRSILGSIISSTEREEFALWLKKLQLSGIVVGALNP